MKEPTADEKALDPTPPAAKQADLSDTREQKATEKEAAGTGIASKVMRYRLTLRTEELIVKRWESVEAFTHYVNDPSNVKYLFEQSYVRHLAGANIDEPPSIIMICGSIKLVTGEPYAWDDQHVPVIKGIVNANKDDRNEAFGHSPLDSEVQFLTSERVTTKKLKHSKSADSKQTDPAETSGKGTLPKCPKCGRELKADSKFCLFCGASVPSSAVLTLEKTQAKRDEDQPKSSSDTPEKTDTPSESDAPFEGETPQEPPASPSRRRNLLKRMVPGKRKLLAMAGGIIAYVLLALPLNAWQPFGTGFFIISPSYAIPLIFGLFFGPVAGFVVGFVGSAVSDAVSFNIFFWNWCVGIGLTGLVFGLSHYLRRHVESPTIRQRISGGIRTGFIMLFLPGIAAIVGMGFASWIDYLAGTGITATYTNFITSTFSVAANGLVFMITFLGAYQAFAKSLSIVKRAVPGMPHRETTKPEKEASAPAREEEQTHEIPRKAGRGAEPSIPDAEQIGREIEKSKNEIIAAQNQALLAVNDAMDKAVSEIEAEAKKMRTSYAAEMEIAKAEAEQSIRNLKSAFTSSCRAVEAEQTEKLNELRAWATAEVDKTKQTLIESGKKTEKRPAETPASAQEKATAKPETKREPASIAHHTCPHCGREVEEHARFCDLCGNALGGALP